MAVAGVDILSDLWEAAKTAGPFGTLLMLILYYRQDGERRQLLADYKALLRETLDGLNSTRNAVVDLAKTLEPPGDREPPRRRGG
jgi:hypothetical protein